MRKTIRNRQRFDVGIFDILSPSNCIACLTTIPVRRSRSPASLRELTVNVGWGGTHIATLALPFDGPGISNNATVRLRDISRGEEDAQCSRLATDALTKAADAIGREDVAGYRERNSYDGRNGTEKDGRWR